MQSTWVFGDAFEIQKFPTDLSAGYYTFGGNVTGTDDEPPMVIEQFDHTENTCRMKAK